MNKTAVRNFSIWARNRLIEEITHRAGLYGISEKGIKPSLEQSDKDVEYYDIGISEPFVVRGREIRQRRELVSAIEAGMAAGRDYPTAFRQVVEEVAYTWFNRLIAVRFMEVNDYLPSGIRVLSSVSGKNEPDIVTSPFDARIEYTGEERAEIMHLKSEERLDELFRILFVKQCNELSEVLPYVFEKVSDCTELLLSISFTDSDGVVRRLVNDIPEEDFNVKTGGQVEIIGWLYQYYNTEPKARVFSRPNGTKIQKEDIPAATQLFTPDWIVRYMAENSLGRLWIEGHPESKERFVPTQKERDVYVENRENPDGKWMYYIEEAEQDEPVHERLAEIRKEYAALSPEEILCIDPCTGSGHILCAFFDLLMQIYLSRGYTERDAAQSIITNNIWGLDIDRRAAQLAYFALMMKAREHDRRFFRSGITPHVFAVEESNGLNRDHLQYFGANLSESERKSAISQLNGLIEQLRDASEYGSLICVDEYDWALLRKFAGEFDGGASVSRDTLGLDDTQELLLRLINTGETLARKYHVVVTNPPYMGSKGMNAVLSDWLEKHYPDSKSDLFAVFIERCGNFTRNNAYFAMITQHSWMFLSSYEKLRLKLQAMDIVNMAHLGTKAFEEIGGEVVQTTSFVMRKSHIEDYQGIYRRLIEPATQDGKEEMFLSGENRYTAKQFDFSKIPGSPVAYWVGDNFYRLFTLPSSDSVINLREGIHTGKNELFLREWYEVNFDKIVFNASNYDDIDINGKWVPYSKGGAYRKWYGNNELVISFDNDSRMKMATITGHVRPSQNLYFKEGATWSALSSGSFGLRLQPHGHLFDSKGQVAIGEKYLEIMGLFNLKAYQKMADILMPTLDYKCGDVKKLPYCHVDDSLFLNIVQENISLSRTDWDSYETSWDFKRHPLLPPRTPEKSTGRESVDEPDTGTATAAEGSSRRADAPGRDYTPEETEFAVFCIENVAIRLNVDAADVYDAFTKETDLLESYIIPCYDVLHTQGKEYIVNDLIDVLHERGVTL